VTELVAWSRVADERGLGELPAVAAARTLIEQAATRLGPTASPPWPR
jgi:hypothetical protein